MGIIETLMLFGILALLAASPSASVALVVTRSATAWIADGAAVAAGIVLGDLVFILLTVLGLSAAAEAMGSLFMALKYLGAAYLIWLGVSLFRTGHKTTESAFSGRGTGSLTASFLAGFALTLGDVKAILFYASLFPMLLDLAALRMLDVAVIVVTTIAAVGGVKLIYALSATKLAAMAKGLALASAARKNRRRSPDGRRGLHHRQGVGSAVRTTPLSASAMGRWTKRLRSGWVEAVTFKRRVSMSASLTHLAVFRSALCRACSHDAH
ncbi:LysE family translocator [uncultured Thiohalocapsa sp.]|uniref:LysE family translocator n=1 Tax=uncultured Thiohalocapsa sp. TaxID=768990 RepID=UPI0025E2E454|nr:LysE family translocator [uncultured Thiohalocapsa sp.]